MTNFGAEKHLNCAGQVVPKNKMKISLTANTGTFTEMLIHVQCPFLKNKKKYSAHSLRHQRATHNY